MYPLVLTPFLLLFKLEARKGLIYLPSRKTPYRTKVKIGTDADGEPNYVWVSGWTRKELNQAKQDAIYKYKIPLSQATKPKGLQPDVLFGSYVQAWFLAYKEPIVREKTKQDYTAIINKHLVPALGDIQLRAISQNDLQVFLNAKAKKYSASLVHKLYIVLRQVFERATIQRIIDYNPCIGLVEPLAKRGQGRGLTDQEQSAALYVAQNHPEGLLLSLLYYTGARIGEIVGLRWSDIDWSNRTTRIQRDINYHLKSKDKVDEVKTPSSIRTIPIPKPLYSVLKFKVRIGDGYILQSSKTGQHLCDATLRRT